MAATRVQTKGTNGTSDPLTVTFDSSTTAGNYIIVGVLTAFNAFSVISTVTDNKSNTYTQVGTGITVGNGVLSVWRTQNITGGASHQISADFSGSGQNNMILAREYGNIATTTPTDQTGSGTGSGTAVSVTASGITTQAAELSILIVGGQNTGNTLTGTSGYGNAATPVSGGGCLMLVDTDLSSTTTPTATGTLGSFSAWAGRIITVKEGASAPTNTASFFQFM